MLPTKEMIDNVVEGILSGPLANGNYSMPLSKTDFNLESGLGFTEADFPGYAAKTFTNWRNGVDVDNGQRQLTANAPLGGFHFNSNGALTEGQGIFGYEIRDLDNDITIGRFKFATPKEVSAPNMQLNLAEPTFIVPEIALQ